jgi:class III poly(R)-hydroxyalkanoic acid synthase PhaE subunit
MASSLSPVPGDLLRNIPRDPLNESLNRVLSAPGLGYTREEQSQYQDLIRRSMDYQKALQQYLSFFSHLGVKSTERMRDTLLEIEKSGKTIDSARGLYDTWVGCCEDVYAEEVRSADYARIHGELVNAQMAFKQRMSVIVDETLGAMNMPTRSELRTLQDRVQETRRENKALRKELDLLKKQVASVTSGVPSAPPRPKKTLSTRTTAAPRKKAAARKKTAAKATAKPAAK